VTPDRAPVPDPTDARDVARELREAVEPFKAFADAASDWSDTAIASEFGLDLYDLRSVAVHRRLVAAAGAAAAELQRLRPIATAARTYVDCRTNAPQAAGEAWRDLVAALEADHD
jgi:hypothetical protein